MADTKRPPDDAVPDRPTEELVAFLDGELDPKEAEAVATRLSLDPRLRAEAEGLQRTWDILDVLPRPQPSSAFATRTVSQVVPVPSAASGTQFLAGSAATTALMPARRTGTAFWVVSALLVLAAGAGGYAGHLLLAPKPADPPLEDVPLMKNLRLYRNVEDMEYLKKLESPELFGDEGE